MDDALRLAYLDAMGITRYVARAPLPGALPSPLPDIAGEEASANPPARAGELLATVEMQPAAQVRPAPAVVAAATMPAPAAPAQAPSGNTAAFQCQLAMWVIDDLLVLADMPRLDNPQQVLLRNILQAIGRNSELAGTRQYNWPIAQSRQRSLHAAREHFQGLLDGGLLASKGLQQILCFGDAAATLLVTGNDEAPATTYRHWPVITVCPLHDMLAEPSRKADTWRKLQVLVRH